MGRIVVETFIRAPREVVFDLALDVEAHIRSAAFSGERVVPPGKTSGMLGAGDEITFEGHHFGVRQRFTVRITNIDRPNRFDDRLVRSAFRELTHAHEFRERYGGTLMTDTLHWTAPFGILGRLADRLFVERGMRRFVARKQAALKGIAEEVAGSRGHEVTR